ncbi:MAG: DUF5696 domain-containing protein, partial [Oscillospiraceae bacterium]|nr:DUF5696 domain-containing protein [Oscillospiraceae bacterium]
MKRFLSAALALLMLLSLASCAPLGDGHGNIVFRTYFESSTEEYIFENGYLKLRFDPATTWFIVEDKITGEEWHSNPPNAAVDNADIITRRIMQSLLDINYSARDGNTARIDSFTFGVNKGFYEYEIHDNGFSVHFTVGDVERTFYIPQAVPEWRMNEITRDMTDSEIRDLTNKYGYRLYDLDRLFSFDNVDELMARFPDLEENRVFYMNPDTGTHLKEAAEMLFERYGYTYEDYYADLEFYETGRIVTDPVFNITVQVEIIDYELRVTVPFDSIEYRSEFPPVELSLLPYFGAGGLNDEGFMFVPDGSGALINFNNGKNNQNPYSNRIYGWDEGLSRDAIVLDPRAHFPVFGIEKNGSAMLCVIEEGTPYASIKAGVSGMGGSYNNVYAEYSVVSREQMEISGKSDKNVLIFQRDLPEGEGIVQRYFFCERNGYMGMAEKYREYLLERHPHLEKPAESVVPVAVEITGAVNKIQHVAGLPFDLPLKLTSYKEAADIVSDLDSRGFTDVNYRLTGWFNGSVQHAVPTNIRLISRLGNSRDLRDLVSTVNNLDSQIYLEADFLFMRDNKPFNSFSLNRDAARYINRKRVELYPYSYIWYGPMEWFKMARIARPVYMMGLIDGFIEQIASYGAQNVAFRTIGSHLTGDFNERRFVSREESMKMQVAKLQEMRENGNGIM